MDIRLIRKTVEVIYYGNRVASNVRAENPKREPIINNDLISSQQCDSGKASFQSNIRKRNLKENQNDAFLLT